MFPGTIDICDRGDGWMMNRQEIWPKSLSFHRKQAKYEFGKKILDKISSTIFMATVNMYSKRFSENPSLYTVTFSKAKLHWNPSQIEKQLKFGGVSYCCMGVLCHGSTHFFGVSAILRNLLSDTRRVLHIKVTMTWELENRYTDWRARWW